MVLELALTGLVIVELSPRGKTLHNNPPLGQHPDIIARSIGEELVAYHPKTQQAFLLTPPAAQVYRDVESLTVSDLEAAQRLGAGRG